MVKHIFGQLDLESFLNEHPKQYNVIHYTDSRWEPLVAVTVHAKDWLHMPFDDVDKYDYENIARKITPPRLKDVKKMLEWAKGKKDLIVACRAGISRSSATAYIITAQEHGADGGLSILNEYKHFPNRLIVYLGSQALRNPSIWKKFVDWQMHHKHHDPSRGGQWPDHKIINEIHK